MKIEAGKLRLVNIGQLIEVVSGGTTVMGKLERVKRAKHSAEVALRVSGDSVTVSDDSIVHMIRNSEFYELRNLTEVMEDVLSEAEAQGLPTPSFAQAPVSASNR